MAATVRGFCQAILDQGWEGYMDACLAIMSQNQYWPTYDGALTDQWNRARPYPTTSLSGPGEEPDSSRTGGRSEGGRPGDTNSRPGYGDYGGSP